GRLRQPWGSLSRPIKTLMVGLAMPWNRMSAVRRVSHFSSRLVCRRCTRRLARQRSHHAHLFVLGGGQRRLGACTPDTAGCASLATGGSLELALGACHQPDRGHLQFAPLSGRGASLVCRTLA